MLAPDPGAARFAGVKLAVTPAGNPVAERAIGLLKLPETLTVTPAVTLEPCFTLTDDALRPRVKFAGGVIVTLSEAFCVTVPPFAVTWMV